MKDKIIRCQVDIYVVVPGDTSNVAVEGTIAEGIDHGVMFLLGDIASHGQIDYVVWSAGKVGEDEVPGRITKAWDEAKVLALEPENP